MWPIMIRAQSLIDGNSNTNIRNITVGENHTSIAVDDNVHKVYVTNSDSGIVSVIDTSTKKVVAGVTFNINPPNSGQIMCNNMKVITNLHFYIGLAHNALPNRIKVFNLVVGLNN